MQFDTIVELVVITATIVLIITCNTRALTKYCSVYTYKWETKKMLINAEKPYCSKWWSRHTEYTLKALTFVRDTKRRWDSLFSLVKYNLMIRRSRWCAGICRLLKMFERKNKWNNSLSLKEGLGRKIISFYCQNVIIGKNIVVTFVNLPRH